MKVNRSFSACIVCLDAEPDSWEHIFPKFLGGRLQARLLCTRCNNTFGSSLVASAKSDASIRLALEDLKDKIPKVANQALNKSTFVGDADDGSTIRVTRRKGETLVLPSRGPEGQLNFDTSEAVAHIKRIMLKSGATSDDVENIQRRFADLPNSEPISLTPDRIVVKKPLPTLKPELSSKSLDDRLVVLMALEFFAIVVGDHIYNRNFDSARTFIMNGTNSNDFEIEPQQAGKTYGTIHAIFIEPSDEGLAIQIRLFRWLSYRIIFKEIKYNGPDCIYFEDISDSTSYFAPTHADASDGRWMKL